jgi:hypothetical protein
MINSHPYFAQTDGRDGWENVPRREPGSTPLVQCILVMVKFLITAFKAGVGNIYLSHIYQTDCSLSVKVL